MDLTKVQVEESEKISRSEVLNSRRLLELEKFEESVLNPSEEFTKSNLVRTPIHFVWFHPPPVIFSFENIVGTHKLSNENL